jgi:hypothetical protein
MGYCASPKGAVDFVGFSGWAVEVKWSERQYNLSRAFRDMVCPDKTVWNQHNLLEQLPHALR